MLTKEAVLSALNELGSTIKEVAASLNRLGIKGVCGSPNRCVLANYLQSKFPDQLVAITITPLLALVGSVRVDLPKPFVKLVHDFDQFRFPDLQEGSA